ncbi:hypothetical protein [Caldanaerobacter subterraneus]|uniref:Uncharacterized protein n=1 Tax=Caldanaerobacter subterraneus TaxID=911092 RepID=A0A7Y2L7M9_9THEO|nr:hypothetical protein [Caldanaerobacter subterraneus]NNG67318.1 hypothetical protein [Caldanaerobacter subterraneus]
MNMSWGHSEEREKKQYTLKLTIEELIRLEEAVKTSLKAAEDMYMFFEKQTYAKELDSKQQKYARQRVEGYMRDIEAFRNILKKIEEEVK